MLGLFVRAGVALPILVLAACGGTGPGEQPEVEGAAPTPTDLARGTWSLIGRNLLVKFSADGTFVWDTHSFVSPPPAVSGTYELDGKTMNLATAAASVVCGGERWTRVTGLTEDDELNIYWVTPGCKIREAIAGSDHPFFWIAGTQWTMTLLPPG